MVHAPDCPAESILQPGQPCEILQPRHVGQAVRREIQRTAHRQVGELIRLDQLAAPQVDPREAGHPIPCVGIRRAQHDERAAVGADGVRVLCIHAFELFQ